VGRGDDHVVEARRRRHAAAHRQHLVVEEADRVERHDPDAMLAVVDHGGDGLQIVMDFRGRAVVGEAGHPHRLRHVGVDDATAEAGPEARRHRRRRAGGQRELGTRIAIVQVPPDEAGQAGDAHQKHEPDPAQQSHST
jgi:hypothetical protein